MKTQCPHCKARFNTNEKSIGKQAKCPKCSKPFTIEPFIETPVVVEPPAKSPELVAPPALSGVATAKSDKSPPLARPLGSKAARPAARPLAGPEPVETPAKIAESVAPPVKSPEPVELPVKSVEPIKPPVKSAEAVAATSAEPARLAEDGESRRVKGEKPKAKALSKAVFVYCWMAVRIIAGILGGLGLMLAIRKGANSTLIATFAAADVFFLCSVAIELALFYKMWAAIQDNQASISPAKAVGFLFIPVFNIYWALLMVTGFVEDYNAFIRRRSEKTNDLPMSLFLIYAFMFILAATVLTTPMICVFAFIRLISRAFIAYTFFSWVLFFFVLAAGVAHFISYILVAIKTCNAINALPERKSR
jgi:predicted Zn finger-like uncharacterized protein